jgi:hypothetical protein
MVTVFDSAARVINEALGRILRYHSDREWAAKKERPRDGFYITTRLPKD